jgi:N-acyl-D-aspartate/D-glutamate deacylase
MCLKVVDTRRVSGVVNPELKKFDGKTIAQIADAQKKSQLDTLLDFIIADKGQTGLFHGQ